MTTDRIKAFSGRSAGVNSAHGFIASRFVCQSPVPNIPSRLEYLRDLEKHLEPIPSDTSPLAACSPL